RGVKTFGNKTEKNLDFPERVSGRVNSPAVTEGICVSRDAVNGVSRKAIAKRRERGQVSP
ncbi:MAG: hypothetical protein KGR69_11130, partial [Verrucomicrobia bacterium]|nr:hypothetical protein [Verrucomicrobiota bacterium]